MPRGLPGCARHDPTQFVSRLTRKNRSNSFDAFLCLPQPQREALYGVYAFCRIADDAVDLDHDRAAQRKELERWRAEIVQVFEGSPCRRFLGRPASDSGRLCHWDGGHEWGDRCRRVLMLPTLRNRTTRES